MTVTDLAKKLGEWAALLAIVGVVGSLWIDREVERRMGELKSDPADSPVVVTLKAEVENIEASQVRIEAKVDAFSSEFLKYLTRQSQE